MGVISALNADDYVVSHYRDHEHALAKGMDPKVVMAELFGKATGSEESPDPDLDSLAENVYA